MTVTEIDQAPQLPIDEFDRPMPWYGVLAPEGITTGDKRRFAKGSLRSRDLPLPLAYQPTDLSGHDGAVVVANIQRVWREGDLVMGSGEFTSGENAARAVDLIAEGMLRGISVDLDDVTLSASDESEDGITEVSDGRISSATIVRIPAFAEAFIALGTWAEAQADADNLDQESVVAGCLPCELLARTEFAGVSDKPWSNFTKADYSDSQWARACVLDRGPSAGSAKQRYALPIAEPSGALNRNGVHAAAAALGGARGGVNASSEAKAAAARKLRGAYSRIGEEPPDSLKAAAEIDEFAVAVGEHVSWTDNGGTQHVGVVEAINGGTATVIEDSDGDQGGESFQVPLADLFPAGGKQPPVGDKQQPPVGGKQPAKAASDPDDDFAAGTRDGPGWLTNPRDSQRLRNYWTRGAGAAKIRWGVPGDFNRCRRQLAKYVPNPQWLAGTCANLHKVAIGVWPGQEASSDGLTAAAPAFTLVSSVSSSAAPAEWFADPKLESPTPITVTADGRIFGHAATWGTCHIGFKGLCRTAPHSSSDYARFLLGSYLTEQGESIRVGTITMGTGHAGPHDSAQAAAGHYDNTGFCAAYVNAGEDEHGIWVAGTLAPGLSDADTVKLRAAKLSGDWRQFGDELDLVGVLAVNVPGFPVLAASGETQLSLVAAGILPDPEPEPASHQPTPLDMARMVAREMVRLDAHRSAAAQARRVFAAERISRAEKARQILEGQH